MSLKYMILGLVKDFPAHGYDILQVISRDFADQGPEINKGQLYSLVKKMEEDGLIVREVFQQDNTPNRKMIIITPKGEEDFDNWLRSDDEEYDSTRYDFFSKYGFLYKVSHFNMLGHEEIIKKLNQQIEFMEDKYNNFINARESMLRKNVDRFRIYIIEYGIEIQKAKMKWLKRIKKELMASDSHQLK